MNNLSKAIQRTLDNGQKCFVPYIMAGDGGLDQLVPRLEFLQKAGAAMVEIGIPFSDPAADGPVIQAAGMRALKEGTNLTAVLEELQGVRERVQIPLLFMTYLNPVLSYGKEAFAEQCREIGIDACIIPDLPYEEEAELKPILIREGISLIRLASITSTHERLRNITEDADGFIYAVTVKGVTGARKDIPEETRNYLRALKEISPIPVFAGFGIATPEHVRMMGECCDGVVVGSKIIECFRNGDEAAITELIQTARKASV